MKNKGHSVPVLHYMEKKEPYMLNDALTETNGPSTTVTHYN